MDSFSFFSRCLISSTSISPSSIEHCLSQRLLHYNGLTFSSSKGIHALLPFFVRSLEKLENLIHCRLKRNGCQRVVLPTLGDRKLWEKTDRWLNAGAQLFKTKDRTLHEYCLQPTHEEEVTNLLSSINLSYKSLPVLLYQVTNKFRDELHPKYGLIRSREFLMQDLYSFDIDLPNAKQTYARFQEFYVDLLCHLGLPFIKAQADSGHIGGLMSHEFHIPLPIGEDKINVCRKCNFAVNQELSDVKAFPECSRNACPGFFDQIECIEVAHTFLLGERYTRCFNAKCNSPSGTNLLQMGCYGLGVTRLMAAAVEYLSRTIPCGTAAYKTEIRWPIPIVPYAGAIALQKESAVDAFRADDLLNFLLAVAPQNQLTTPHHLVGDILIDDRDGLSLGRKIVDLKRLGIPWILVAKSKTGAESKHYELMDVYKGKSYAVNLEQIRSAFTETATFDTSCLPIWNREQTIK